MNLKARPSVCSVIHRGFTLVETLVSIGIIGLLVAITLPAVQSSREVARRAQCLNNLRQLMLACHEHETAHGCFPVPNIDGKPWTYAVMPYLELPTPVITSTGVVKGLAPAEIVRCPSDPDALGYLAAAAGACYYPNGGHGDFERDGFLDSKTGGPMHIRDFSDGASTTMAFSERRAMLAPANGNTDFTSRAWHHRLVRKTSAYIADIDDFADECEYRSILPLTVLQLSSSYNTVQTPNRYSCSNGDIGVMNGVSSASLRSAISATSLHPGGVNVTMVDGSGRFVSDSIDRTVWRAIGTRNGAEPIGEF